MQEWEQRQGCAGRHGAHKRSPHRLSQKRYCAARTEHDQGSRQRISQHHPGALLDKQAGNPLSDACSRPPKRKGTGLVGRKRQRRPPLAALAATGQVAPSASSAHCSSAGSLHQSGRYGGCPWACWGAGGRMQGQPQQEPHPGVGRRWPDSSPDAPPVITATLPLSMLCAASKESPRRTVPFETPASPK